MVKNLLSILVILFAIADYSYSQNISTEASTDTTAYRVGDYIHYTIKIRADKNLSVIGPSVSDTLAGMELISQQVPRKEVKDNEQVIAYSYTFSNMILQI